jgi:NTE family protein
LNAAFVSTREPTVDTAAELEAVWRGLGRRHVFPPNPLTAAFGLLGLQAHTVPSSALRRIVRHHLGLKRLQDAPIALHVVATDVLTGEEVLLSEGSAVDAVLASAAIPGVFPPVTVGGRLLMDGGVMNNTPISHAVALGADRVIVLAAMGPEILAQAPRGALGAAMSGMSRAICRRFAEDVRRYRDSVDLIVLTPPRAAEILPTDFGQADLLIAEGLRVARGVLRRSCHPAQHRRAA